MICYNMFFYFYSTYAYSKTRSEDISELESESIDHDDEDLDEQDDIEDDEDNRSIESVKKK